jgi:hypothetical protein
MEADPVRPILITIALAVSMIALAAGTRAQQAETGPKSNPQSEHPVKGPETGVRGPSNGSPDTGPHGPRDVTKNAEPGKAPPASEQRQTGQLPQTPSTKKN